MDGEDGREVVTNRCIRQPLGPKRQYLKDNEWSVALTQLSPRGTALDFATLTDEICQIFGNFVEPNRVSPSEVMGVTAEITNNIWREGADGYSVTPRWSNTSRTEAICRPFHFPADVS